MALLPELTLQLVLLRFGALLVIVAIQGLAVAGTAVLLGDPGPRYDGRLTANPFVHLDLSGSLALLLFGLGWSKPVAIETKLLRGGRAGPLPPVLVAFAGLLLAAVALRLATAPALSWLPYTAGIATAAFLRIAAALTLASALVNLLPVPPLTAGLLAKAIGIEVPPVAVQILSVALLVAAGLGLLHALIAPGYAALAAWIELT